MTWKKHPANPILSTGIHGETRIWDWRDPFVFKEGGRVFLVTGGNLDHQERGKAIVLLYEAKDDELTQWEYRGILFQHPNEDIKNIECPNFFRLGDKWILVLSPHGKVEYTIGDFDIQTCKFRPERYGLMDHGRAYYAPNCLLDNSDRRILWGWVRGFPEGKGWNGCLTLPRILSIDRQGELKQEPAPELERLRGERRSVSSLVVDDGSRTLEDIRGDCLEIRARFENGNARSFGLTVSCASRGRGGIPIAFGDGQLRAGDALGPVRLAGDGNKLELRVFLDKSVLEVYANGRECFTSVIPYEEGHFAVSVFAEGGKATLAELDAWSLEPI